MSLAKAEAAIEDALERGVFPGAVLLVRDSSRLFYLRAFGRRSILPVPSPMHEDTVFDVASLTKAFATSVAVMWMVKEGNLRLDDRVTRFFHNFGVYGKTHVTFRHLLSHCSGLPAWRPYFKDVIAEEHTAGRVNFLASPAARAFVYQLIQRERPDTEPVTAAVYSDLGFMLLGAVVEQISGQGLDRFCHDRIFRPLGLRSTGFVDLSVLRQRQLEPATDKIAPTENCPWRRRVLCGEVHDDNAYAMGGVAGHAGLFSSAKDLDTMLVRLKESYRNVGQFLPQRVVREFWTRDGSVAESTWCLGWDSPSAQGSSAGSFFSPRSVGHLGFTGCSAWLDLERDRHVIFLTNRVHPTRTNEAIREFRPVLHDAILEALG